MMDYITVNRVGNVGIKIKNKKAKTKSKLL